MHAIHGGKSRVTSRARCALRLALASPLLLVCGQMVQPATAAPAAKAAKKAPAVVAANPSLVFSYQDYLNRDWSNEALQLPLSPATLKLATAKRALLGPDGKEVAYQVASPAPGAPPAIEFMANIAANQKAEYKFADAALSPQQTTTDLKLEDGADSVRISNSVIGIALRKKLEAGQGPIESIRLRSGKWVGGSRLDAKLVPTAYTVKIVQQGPVQCEVQCSAEFGDGSSWQQNYRLAANEPVVEVDENMALGDKAGLFSLSLSDGFDPTKLFYRSGKDGTLGENLSSDIGAGVAFVLEPWVHWWVRPTEGPVFSAYNEASPDMLSVGASFAASWVDPKMPATQRGPVSLNVVKDDSGLHLDFPLRNGRRQWIIATPDKDASLAVLADPKIAYTTSVPHALLIKHGQFPLQLVKDYVLDWKSEGEVYPHLLLTKAQADAYRAAHADTKLSDDAVHRLTSLTTIGQFSMTDPIQAYFASGDERLGAYLIDQAKQAMQEAVDTFLLQPFTPYGSAPHHQQQLGTAPLIADAILGSDLLTAPDRKKLLAQLAFCGYAVDRPDFWSEERGFSANPNMTTSVLGYDVALGSSVPSNPHGRVCVDDGLNGLKAQLFGWSDSNGGWLEAPHYAMVSYDAILGSLLMAHNAGLSDLIYDPQMKKVISWFAKWSTPKDSRFQGFRHLPPVGNTYISEPTGEFGIVAHIWKDKDPQFASEMQWMYRQQHSWAYPGIGGGYPTMAGYRGMLIDSDIPEKQPDYQTELFPNTGVMLRSGFKSDRETSMLLLANGFGGWRSHYDDDSGSFTLWGKGRIMADDFGYYGMAPANDHNKVDSAEIRGHRLFDLATLAPDKDVDYLSGDKGPWKRQVAFLKSEDPLAPNYFVLCDTTKTTDPAIWRLWMTAAKVTPNGNSALMEGKEDVDMDIFFASPTPLDLTTEVKTRTSGSGMRPDGSNGPTATTQIGLILNDKLESANTYVLYPRLKTEAPPVFTSLAGGKGVSIKTAAGTDYVFLSATPFTFTEGTISFSGVAGAVRFRGNKVTLILGEGGTIAARGKTLTATKAARQEFMTQ